MQATEHAVNLYKQNGWDDASLEQSGYTVNGQPQRKLLDDLLKGGWTEQHLFDGGYAEVTSTPGFNAEEKVSRYVQLRDEESALKKEQKEALKPYDEEMEQIASELGGFLQQTGSESSKTLSGTFFWVDKTSVSMPEQQEFLQWFCKDIINQLAKANMIAASKKMDDIIEQAMGAPALGFLTKAVAKDTVTAYVEKHGNPPPGLKVEKSKEVQVRRASKK